MKRSFLIVVLPAVALISSALAAPPDWVQNLASHPALGQQLSENKLLRQWTTIRYSTDGSGTTQHDRLAFLNGGTSRFADFSYSEEHWGKDKLEYQGGWLISPDKEIERIPAKARRINNAFDANILFSDHYISRWSLDNIPVGAIVALEYTIRIDELVDYGRIYVQDRRWDSDSTVIQFETPPPAAVVYDVMQIDAAILAANQHEIRIGHLPKWKESPFGGEFELSAAQVAFRYYPDGDTTSSPSSWLDIADAVGAKWEKVNRNLPEDQRRVILDNLPEWPADLDTVEARFERLFRYVAVEVGDGNYIPHEPRQVLQYKYGDCKDLSLLMAELLRLRNIDAYPILVQMPAWRMFDSSYPSMRQFNHCIVAIVRLGDTTYYDPTAKGYDIGALPWADQGAPALWLGESSQFLTLPRDAVPLRLQRTLRGTLDSRGDFAGTLTLSFDARIPDAEWRPTSQNDAYELLQRHLQDKLAADMTAHRVDTANSEFEAEINIRHWAAMHGRDCYWNVNPFGYNLPDTLSLEPATATAYVRRPFITRDELAVKLPATVTAEVFADEQVTLGPDQASFKCHTSADSLAGFWELELHRTSYATHERADLDSLLKSAAGQHRATIKLRL